MAQCPRCGQAAPDPARAPGLLTCRGCGLTSLTPFPAADPELYQDDYYQAGTGSRFLALPEALALALRGRRARAILHRQPGPGTLLDLGCGRGELLQRFQQLGWRVLGTQISRTAAEAAREQRGVDVRLGELPDMTCRRPASR